MVVGFSWGLRQPPRLPAAAYPLKPAPIEKKINQIFRHHMTIQQEKTFAFSLKIISHLSGRVVILDPVAERRSTFMGLSFFFQRFLGIQTEINIFTWINWRKAKRKRKSITMFWIREGTSGLTDAENLERKRRRSWNPRPLEGAETEGK